MAKAKKGKAKPAKKKVVKKAAPKKKAAKKSTPKKAPKKAVRKKAAPKAKAREVGEFAFQEAPAPNFKYVITRGDAISVSLLDINGTVIKYPKDEDKVFADKGIPFYINLKAESNSFTDSGTLQVTCLSNNKNLFDSAKPIVFESSKQGYIKEIIQELPC